MPNTRLTVRVFLCLLLVAMVWLVMRARTRNSPAQRIAHAEQAIQEGELETAKIYLLNALKDDNDNAPAHRFMAELLLAEANAKGEPATYQLHYEARQHLSTAARLLPEDADLQTQLLGIFLDRGSLGAAIEVADHLHDQEPNNPEVLVALLAKAVSAKNFQRAEQTLLKLQQYPTPRVYRAASLATRLYTVKDHSQQRAETLASVVQQASKLTAKQLAKLPQAEQLLMVYLLRKAIQESDGVELAHERADVALDVCQRIKLSDRQISTELAGFAADVLIALRGSHPLTTKNGKARQVRRELIARGQQYLDNAIETEQANFAIYREAATTAFQLQEHEKVEQILTTALATASEEQSEAEASTARQRMQLHLLAARNLFAMRRYSAAKHHLKVLQSSSEPRFSGWGELLAGGVSSSEGRYETALKHYLKAQRLLGRTPFVEVALAKTYLVLGRWDDALPLLERVGRFVDSSDPSHISWTRLHNMFEQQVRWGQFYANLALDRWDVAQEFADQLRGTKQESRAEALAASYLASHDQMDAALERVSRAREKFPDEMSLLLTHVRLLVQAKQSDEAKDLVESLVKREDLSSQICLAIWRLQEKKYGDAERILAALEQRFPDNPMPSFLKSKTLLAAGKPREALAIAAKLRESPETSAAGNLLAIMQSLREQNLSEAAEGMHKLAEEVPSVSPRMNLFSGRLSAAQGDFATAIKQAGDSLDVTGLRQQARSTLLESLLLLTVYEGPEEAAEVLAPLLKRHPDDAFLGVVEADLKFKQGAFDEGMAILNRVDLAVGRKPTPAYIKASVWAQVGNVQRALDELRRCLSVDSDFLAAHVLAAKLHLTMGNHQEAATHAGTVLKSNPRHWQLYLVRAEALRGLGRPSEALGLLQLAIKLEPRFLAAYRGLASLHLAALRPEDARRICQLAQKALPQSMVPVTDEIAILCQQEQLEEAEALAAQSVGSPAEAGKCLAVSRTFFSLGQMELSQRWALKALELSKDTQRAPVYLQLGEVALWEGQQSGDRKRLEAARDYFSQVVEVSPHHFVAGNNLAWLLATEFDQPQQALEVIKQVRGKATVDQVPVGFLDTLAVVYRRAGKLDEARELLGQALESYPKNPLLMYHLGMVLADRGQSAAAQNMLERAIEVGGLPEEKQNEASKMLQALAGGTRTQP